MKLASSYSDQFRETIKLPFRLNLVKLLHNLAITLLPFSGFIYVLSLILKGVSPQLSDLLILIGMWAISGLGITVGFHRLLAHHSFSTMPAIKIAFAIMGCMAAQGPPIIWVSIHRKHHEYSDRPGDPHSPCSKGSNFTKLRGWWHAHLGWMFAYEIPNPARYASDLLRDRDIRWVNQTYFLWVVLGFVIPAIVEAIITQSWIGLAQGVLWGGLVRLFVVQNIVWSINSFCHLIGERGFKTEEGSRNIGLLSIPSLGESWHNNHHAFPHSARFGLKWWQVDMGYGLIALLERLGWVYAVKSPSMNMIRAKQVS
uniref:Stearoyl-CoA 9-desaturase n=1 Tax=Cyanothece sp. (strain PCC 7425 / ATCC 29141) TaxID=395961 RepID=B8HKZ1_CYAP4